MLFGPNTRYFNELEINGEHVDDGDDEDFTINNQNAEEDDDNEPENNDTPEDQNDEGENNDFEDFTDDEFTDDEPEVDDEDQQPDQEQQNNDEESEDDTEPEDNEGTENDLEDFTDDDFADDGGEDNQNDTVDDNEGAAEDNTDDDDTTDDSEGTEDTSDSNSGTLADMEKNLFSDLTPNQMAIKNNELLQNYIELYETINTIFDNINKIPKTYENTRPLTFIADQLIDLKDMVNYVITDTYITKTYVENMAYYKQALVVLSQINTMLKALIQKPAK